jgi:hypothetical protein
MGWIIIAGNVIECHSDRYLFHQRLADVADRRKRRFAALQQTFRANCALMI